MILAVVLVWLQGGVVACYSTCLTCSGSGASQCSTCDPSASLSGGPPGTGDCPSGKVHLGAVCGCDPSCATCNGSTAGDCLSCYTGAVISGSACVCVTNYVQRPDLAHCSPVCDDTCNTCSGTGDSDCLSCYANAHLVGGSSPAKAAGHCTGNGRVGM